ncbi:MAG TPA: Lrp/AsnC family transcriptional regulator [Candidatus Fournierella merdipullorum]|uniref:Lrp/AsnC family transcriptional regulator n=1 Tax=Candidatus Allofournierella merdipullorum TaxID=2838595 RepID=A0A9D2E539_9FIRM|nr:Lrp/AsnC family transcriptional regulator [Candidatus Fournierella merdipullorum]
MDKLDKKILSLLAQNARMSVKEIAERVSLTSPAVSSRIHRLEKEGVIGGYTVLLKSPGSQQAVNALISVSVAPADRDEFLAAVNGERQVTQCFHVTGSHSYIVKVACDTMQSLEHLITRCQRSGPTSTQIILSTPVDRRPDPMETPAQ